MADQVKLPADSFEPLDKSAHLDSEKIAAPNLTFLQDAWRRLRKNKSAVIAMIILILFFLAAFGSAFISPHNPNAVNPQFANLPPKWPGVDINGLNGTLNQAGSRVNAYAQAHAGSHFYLLGTDYLGRDLLSRILYGTRISLTVAVIATAVDLLFGVTFGLFSGWQGGRIDNFMQRLIEIIMSIPQLVVVVLLILVLKPGMMSITIAIAFSSWTTMARLIRAQTLELKEQEYVLAARTLGESSVKIAFKHLLPNLSSIIIIQTMFTIPSAIFFEAFLSYIGIGISSPQASLGTLLNDGQKNFQFLPYQMWYPAIVLSVIMIAFNVFADGLRDAFDPQTKE
ncbi:peptide ABC transporter permease [Secundilactobacillus paracollinoides]|uniref:Peptide ABC transporter permease n=1 Tax=Secundilactobacillus paracollinoides TaxID=240427 RepID=A0A1B2IZ42_9LACO|nr:ABC transporter permease [Secundilactobacillus paracollinoides]ANZ61402.1 peptide ABC transporter permease [Secundilactobacillus paracollinoides]ANZ64205.1 peptide ABC transporter permease [Secundilactobacillus paracollinoides]ANZ67322.1 peptide ABC transporter permease [Secundilactobacillus paracollinoides]KRL77933.1 ABC-type dipeptide oligopeptide nickel transport system, permease component [Secundilactobacillus paracollinoides DSM 15502 = JCM 11969]